MGRVILVTSGKGGVGKTTTVINLAAALNRLNKEVVVVDANLNTPNVGLHFGAPLVPVTLNHVLKGKADVQDAIYEHSSGIKIVPSSLSIKELKGLNVSKLGQVIRELRDYGDYVIVDSAAGFGEDVLDLIKHTDEILIVTNPEIPAVTDALKAVNVAKDFGKEVNGVVVNKYSRARYEMPLKSIKSMLERNIVSVIPEDKRVKEAIGMKDAVVHVFPRSKASRKYFELARKVNGEQVEQIGFLRRFFGF